MQAPPRFPERDGTRSGGGGGDSGTLTTGHDSLQSIDAYAATRPHLALVPPALAAEPTAPAPLAEWLRAFAARPENRGALAHWETLPARPARHGECAPPLLEPVA